MARARKTTVPPLQKRIPKRQNPRAIEQEKNQVKRVSDGENRLQMLVPEEAPIPVHVPISPDVQELQRQIDELKRERDLWRTAQIKIPKESEGAWCVDGPPSFKKIPPCPRTTKSAKLGHRSQLQSQQRSNYRTMPLSRNLGLSLHKAHTARFKVMGRSIGWNNEIGFVYRRVQREKKVVHNVSNAFPSVVMNPM